MTEVIQGFDNHHRFLPVEDRSFLIQIELIPIRLQLFWRSVISSDFCFVIFLFTSNSICHRTFTVST